MSGLSVVGDFSNYVGSSGDNNNYSKRRKVQESYDKFRPGFILKVKVRNFTTYSYAEFNLSPTLNMIIGPNGSGKSTLVAAICLGLGGKVDLIKRKTMKSMIKTGQTKSTIEITVKDAEGRPPITIQREFTEKESTWMLNGQTTSERAIKEVCRKFNIQLDNLCHFLPQERVAEFAGLSPARLLLETERTLGDGHLLRMHEDLIKNDNNRQELETHINDIQSRLNKLRDERDLLEEEAKKYEEYQEKTRDLKNHQMLVPYAQLQDLKQRQRHIKQERDAAKRALEQFSMTVRPLEEQLEVAQAEAREKEEEYNELVANRNAQAAYEESKTKLTELNNKIEELKATGKALAFRKSERVKELEILKASRDECIRRRDQISIPDQDEINELKRLRDERHDLVNDLREQLERMKDELAPAVSSIKRIREQIQAQESYLNNTDKLTVLEPNPRYKNKLREEVYYGHKLLREKSGFNYFEAPVVSCDVPDKRYAKYLEKVIDNNTLFSITLISQDDYNKVSNFVFKQYNIPMRVIKQISSSRVIMQRSKLTEIGFDGYLSDFIFGPEEVLSMLYDNSKIDSIPVSIAGLSDNVIRLLTQPDRDGQVPFKKFISGDTLFNIHRSQYGSRQYFYSTEKINPISHYFGSSGLTQQAKEEIKLRIQKLKNEFNKTKKEYDGIQEKSNTMKGKFTEELSKLDSYKEKLDQLQRQKSRRALLEGSIKAKNEQLAKLEIKSQKDYKEKIMQIKGKINQKYGDGSRIMAEISEHISKLSDFVIRLNQQEVLFLQYRNRIITINKLIDNFRERKQELVEAYEEAKRKYDEIKKSDAAKKIKQQSENYTESERRVLSELAKTYLDNNNFTEHIIREKIQLLEDERSVMSTADQSSIDNLRRKLDEIQHSEQELPRLRQEKERLDERIKAIRDVWEPELTQLVQKISLAFNKRFTKVASDGLVELAKNDKFKDWRLQILVKFRQESDLKVLDHQSQSGGERAVSTIFFIMSLQGLADAPFRVVDEINQGMDPKNEKMAHRYLVHTACQNTNSQYFLVTPKLLTGLYYHPDMVVHCIYTGPLIDPVEKNSSDPDFMDFTRLIST